MKIQRIMGNSMKEIEDECLKFLEVGYSPSIEKVDNDLYVWVLEKIVREV